MKRGSVIAPLLLILIGVVFLLKNIHPEIPVFETLFTYWPFLLIAWGMLRLLEMVVWHMRGKALPAAGISGGEWALIIVLTIVGSTAWGVQRFHRDGGFGRIRLGGVEVFGESFDYPLDAQSKPAGKTPRVVVENLRGATRIIGADVTEVKVTGRRTVRAMDRASADKASAAAPMQFNVTGEVVTIRVGADRDEDARVSSDLDITVPRGATIEAHGRRVDYDIADVNGEVIIDSDNSGVRLQNIGGRVRVDLRASDIVRAFDVRGDFELKGRGRDVELENVAGQVTIEGGYSGETILRRIAKPVRFESERTTIQAAKIPGELELSLSTLEATDVTGPVLVRGRSKDVRLTDISDTVTIDLDRGDVEVRQSKSPVSRIDVQVRTGDIEVALPENAKFSINAVTERGTVSNDYDSKLREETFNRGAKLLGSLGPGPEVKLSTDRGTVTLRKIGLAEVNSLPSAPPKPAKPPKLPAIPAAPEPARANNQ